MYKDLPLSRPAPQSWKRRSKAILLAEDWERGEQRNPLIRQLLHQALIIIFFSSSSTTSAICPPTILLAFLAPQVQEPSSTTPSTCTCALQGHTGANVCARLIDTTYSLVPEVVINPGVLVSGLSHLNSKQAITFTTSLTNFPEQNNTSDLKCHLHKIQRR